MSTQYAEKLDTPQTYQDGFEDVISNIDSMKQLTGKEFGYYLTNPPDAKETSIKEGIPRETMSLHEEGHLPIVWETRPKLRQDGFVCLQKWQGVVIDVSKESFLARLKDLTNAGPDEEAEIPIEELSPGDMELLRPGAVFYWNIGYLDKLSGQRLRHSFLRFRRLPAWTREELEQAEKEAKRIQESIAWK